MGRARGSGNVFDAVIGRASGIPTPIMPTENIGIMSGAIRKSRGRRRDERGSESKRTTIGQRPLKGGENRLRRDIITIPNFYDEGNPRKPTPQEFESEVAKQGIYKTDKPQLDSRVVDKIPGLTPMTPKPGFDPSKPSAVMETERVNVQDPTLGGPPEREVPIPKERDTSPRGRAPFSPDERAMARDAFFEKKFSRADERKQSKAMDQEERGNVRDARRDEAAMRGSERGRKRPVTGTVVKRRGSRRRDFTRKRSRMEGRRSREERAAFRDRFVSTLR